MAGLVLVFDLDQTLINTNEYHLDMQLSRHLNKNIIENVLKPAVKNKGKTVSAILLLSNNSNMPYIEKVLDEIDRIVGKKVFDYIMPRNRGNINSIDVDPPKRLEDVKIMLTELRVAFIDKTLGSRVYFFDDNRHEIEHDLMKSHYFLITWPDRLDYTSLKNKITKRILGGKHTRKRSIRLKR